MADQLPLTALLSQALVAFTIESDNEFEHRMPHRTTSHGDPGDRGPWLVSMAMWFNCMQFVTGEAVPVSELQQRARTGTNLTACAAGGTCSWNRAGTLRRGPDQPAARVAVGAGRQRRSRAARLPADPQLRTVQRQGAEVRPAGA